MNKKVKNRNPYRVVFREDELLISVVVRDRPAWATAPLRLYNIFKSALKCFEEEKIDSYRYHNKNALYTITREKIEEKYVYRYHTPKEVVTLDYRILPSPEIKHVEGM